MGTRHTGIMRMGTPQGWGHQEGDHHGDRDSVGMGPHSEGGDIKETGTPPGPRSRGCARGAAVVGGTPSAGAAPGGDTGDRRRPPTSRSCPAPARPRRPSPSSAPTRTGCGASSRPPTPAGSSAPQRAPTSPWGSRGTLMPPTSSTSTSSSAEPPGDGDIPPGTVTSPWG